MNINFLAMSAIEIKAYEIFKTKFSEAEANTLIEYIEDKTEKTIAQKKDIFLNKDDKVEILSMIRDTKHIFLTKDDKIEMVSMIKDTRNEMIKWMFIFWIGQLAAMLAVAKLF